VRRSAAGLIGAIIGIDGIDGIDGMDDMDGAKRATQTLRLSPTSWLLTLAIHA